MRLSDHVENHIAYRQAMGHALVEYAHLLKDFAAWAEARGERFIRSTTVIDWATRSSSRRRAQIRLRCVRDLASVLHADDDRHEVPDRNALGKKTSRRPTPRLLSIAEIRQIMDAALELQPVGSITPLSVHHMLGLMAATGLRRSEATGLEIPDLTADGLMVRNAKNGRHRLVPLDETVTRAMDAYLRDRRRMGGPSEYLFVLANGKPVRPDYLTQAFIRLARQVGLRSGPGTTGTRLHDLRHGFACRALERMIAKDRKAVGRHMLALSTYLGHVNTADTYWYLEATPVLLRQVSQTTEILHEGRVDHV